MPWEPPADAVEVKPQEAAPPSTGWKPPEDAIEVGPSPRGSQPEPRMSGPQAPTGSTAHAAARSFGEGLLPAGAGFSGFAAGAELGLLTGPAAPIASPALGLIGAFAASYGMESLQDEVHKTFFPEDWKQRQIEKEQHKMASFVGGAAAGMVGMSPKTVASEAGKWWTSKVAQRGMGAGLQGGIEAGTEYAQTGTVDPSKVAIAAGMGAAAPSTNRLGKLAEAPGRMAAQKVLGTAKPASGTSTPPPKKPADDASPEEKKAYIDELKRRIEERDANSPIVEAAIRNKETGEIEKMGPKHDEARKAETKDTHEEGFVLESGTFLNRKDAWNHAKKTGQLPEDALPEHPAEGLHSGDLRNQGDPRFQVTEDQPPQDSTRSEDLRAGVPKEDIIRPLSREEHKSSIKSLEQEIETLSMKLEIADNSNNHQEAARLTREIASKEKEAMALRRSMPKVEFKDPKAATWEEVHDHLWDTSTVGEAFDRILDTKGLGSDAQRALLRVLNNSEFIRRAGLSFSKDFIPYKDKTGKSWDTVRGLYQGGIKHNVILGKEGAIKTLLHEALHAGTQRVLREGTHPAAKRMQELFNKYKASHGHLYSGQGFDDVEEFVSVAFTSNEFARLLASIDEGEVAPGSRRVTNMWETFKDIVRQVLNIPPKMKSGLDEVMDTAEHIIEESKDYSPLDSIYGKDSSRSPSVHDFGEAKKKREEARRAKTKEDALDLIRGLDKDSLEALSTDNLGSATTEKSILPSSIKESFNEWVQNNFDNPEDALSIDNKRETEIKFLEDSLDLERESPGSFSPQEVAQMKAALEGKLGPRSVPSISEKEKEDLSKTTSPSVAAAVGMVDVRTIPNKEKFLEYATEIYHLHGEDAAIEFFEAYRKDVKERSIPVPTDEKGLDDTFHLVGAYELRDQSKHNIDHLATALDGFGKRPSLLHPIERRAWDKKAKEAVAEMNKLRDEAFFLRENGKELDPKKFGKLKEVLDKLDDENKALYKKAKAMNLPVGEEFVTGQSRARIFTGEANSFKTQVKEFFANKLPFGEKMAEKANSAYDRKVYGLKTWTSAKDPKTGKPLSGKAVLEDTDRVIELHRHPKDTDYSFERKKGEWVKVPIKKGTSIWEWRNGVKELIGHSDNLELKVGDGMELKLRDYDSSGGNPDKRSEIKIVATQVKISDGNVEHIERHSPYKYIHDAEASARLANMGLQKMIRDAELIENLKKSELFKRVAHGPEQDLEDLPKNWRIPESIDKIPQLRGYHFDPYTAAIIEDFAKNWTPNTLTRVSDAIVKNMMLNPLPHMFNEAAHLFVARGLTGWVDPRQFGRFVSTGAKAWKDVTTQSDFYREIMVNGGAVLGAAPRNTYFDDLIINAGKKVQADKELSSAVVRVAKKLGTTPISLYNGMSRASQKAMWVVRDTMYVQLIHEIMRMNPNMDVKGAVGVAERHMPNYRIGPTVLGSRGIAKVMKNPNITVFSRYHHGVVKSLFNTVKDVAFDPKLVNKGAVEGKFKPGVDFRGDFHDFRKGIDSMLAIGVAMGVMYPLLDSLAESIFGEGAKVRRPGPLHLVQAMQDIGAGDRDFSALLWPIITFNPALFVLAEVLDNHNFFSGKNLYHPHDTAGEKVSDVKDFLLGQLPQGEGVLGIGDADREETFLAKQLDVKVQTPAQRAAARTAKKRELATDKSRETKRRKKEQQQ